MVGSEGQRLHKSHVKVTAAHHEAAIKKGAVEVRPGTVLSSRSITMSGFYTFSAVRNGEIRKSPAGFTRVLIQRGNDWLIAHHHSARRLFVSPSPPSRRG